MAVFELYTPRKLDAARNSLIVQWHYYPGRVEEIMNGWSSRKLN